MADNAMIKFYRGLVDNLPATGADGALYVTTDEGGIYLGTGSGMKRLGDFVQVDRVASLPAKAHENCLYYCVAENILAKWNGTEWRQINKQPTAAELKTLLGLGSMAYVSTVVEDHLSAELVEKINASAEGNHAHSNKDVLDGITSEKVAAWDAAEGNAKGYADDLNEAMASRVEALEGVDHEHANKDLLDTYTQTEENLADAVAKKHEHANAVELAKIADGDKAKWDAVVADHLTSTDKATLESSIKEAKKAGTDAQTYAEGVAGDLSAHIAEADGKFETKEDAGNKLTEAKGYTDTEVGKVQSEVDTLEEYVGTIPSNYTEETVIAYINKKAEETLAAAQGGSSETAASVKQQLDNYKSENDTRVEAVEGAVDAIEADYLKAADKTDLTGLITAEKERAEGIEGGLRTDVDAIKADYLKAADKQALQTQIDTIMSNPDAEGAINSINEFTQYVKDHGTIAEGFRTDINKNEEDIAAEVERAGEAEEALSGRIDTLEAIDHDAYIAADTALKGEVIGASTDASTANTVYGAKKYADEKAAAAQSAAEATAAGNLSSAKTELEGKITDGDAATLAAAKEDASTKVNALAEGQVKTNTEAIATKANAADVYTKTEVDTLLTWGSF